MVLKISEDTTTPADTRAVKPSARPKSSPNDRPSGDSQSISSTFFTHPTTGRKVWSVKNFLDTVGLSPEGRSFGLDFGRALGFTALVSAGVVVSSLIFNTMGAYFFARLEFPRKDLVLLFVIATLLI